MASASMPKSMVNMSCNIIEIDASVDDPFYKEKAIVEVKKKDE